MSKDYSHQKFYCRNCGVQCSMGQYYITDDEVVLCDNCFDENTTICDVCGTILYDPEDRPNSDIYLTPDDKLICRSCFVKYRKSILQGV